MTIQVDPQSDSVQLEISGRYSAAQLLDLIKALTGARAQVAKDPLKPGDIWVAPRASCHTQLMEQTGPDSLLAISFPGIGWIGATLNPAVRAQLVSLLATQQATVVQAAAPLPATPQPTLKIEPGPGGHTVH